MKRKRWLSWPAITFNMIIMHDTNYCRSTTWNYKVNIQTRFYYYHIYQMREYIYTKNSLLKIDPMSTYIGINTWIKNTKFILFGGSSPDRCQHTINTFYLVNRLRYLAETQQHPLLKNNSHFLVPFMDMGPIQPKRGSWSHLDPLPFAFIDHSSCCRWC